MLGENENDVRPERNSHVGFLESLLSQYEHFIQDLTKELSECQNCIKNYINSEPQIECPEQDVLQKEISRRDAMIQNLQSQFGLSQKSYTLTKNQLYSCLHQVEVLETQKAEITKGISQLPIQTLSKSNVSLLPSDFLTKWHLLKAYADSLETRLSKSIHEKNFYRNKIMDIRLEYETILKNQAAEKAKEINQTKTSFKEEIEYLKSSIEKIKQKSNSTLEKRLGAEKETWEYQEHKKFLSIKIQVEQLILENELLFQKEKNLTSVIKKLESDLIYMKEMNETSKNVASTQVECPSLKSQPQPTKSLKYKNIQTEFDFIRPEQLERLQISQHQFEMEYKKILMKFEFTERDAKDRGNRLHERIQQLESLNVHLHDQIRDLSDVNAKLICNKNVPLNSGDVGWNSNEQLQCYPNEYSDVVEAKPLNLQSNEPSWKNDNFVRQKQKLNESRWKLKVSVLSQEIQKLKEDRIQLLGVIDKQQNIASKWKAEFKELAKRTIC